MYTNQDTGMTLHTARSSSHFDYLRYFLMYGYEKLTILHMHLLKSLTPCMQEWTWIPCSRQ